MAKTNEQKEVQTEMFGVTKGKGKTATAKDMKRVSVSEDTAIKLGTAFELHQKSATDLLKRCEGITEVGSDEQNTLAREIAKASSDFNKTVNNARKTLNKPLKERTDKNNADAKSVITPIEAEIERIKGLIGDYEQKKEKARQEALKKAEEERLAKEKEERERQEKIQAIRDNINNIQQTYTAKVNECKTSKTLEKYKGEIQALSVSKKEFGDQVDSMKQVKDILLSQVEQRMPIVKELEKASGEEKEELVAKEQERQAEEIQTLSFEEQSMEANAEQFVYIGLTRIESECDWKLEDKAKELLTLYGSYVEVEKNLEQIIAKELSLVQSKDKIDTLVGDKVKNQRKEVKFKIVDENKIPREFLKVDETKIRKAMGENRNSLKEDIESFKIEGVEFYIELTTVLK
jgi:hypothetical protein